MTLQYKVFYGTEELNKWMRDNDDNYSDIEINVEVNNEGEPTFIVNYDEDFEDDEEEE